MVKKISVFFLTSEIRVIELIDIALGAILSEPGSYNLSWPPLMTKPAYAHTIESKQKEELPVQI